MLSRAKRWDVQNEFGEIRQDSNYSRPCRPKSKGELLKGFEQEGNMASLVSEKDVLADVQRQLREESKIVVQKENWQLMQHQDLRGLENWKEE